ncbi:MAG: transporter substrate-binding domain-containing protein [Planctomycetes bacterium]|nr:transporter substrate-binding domain-containing protein [Planctomycetota bacterium]
MVLRVCFVLLLLAGAVRAGESGSAAPGQAERLRVGVYVNPPFVIRDGDTCSGMAVDLWRSMEDRLNLHCDFSEYGSIRELIEAAGDNRVDVCVANLAVTSERAASVLFTFPWFDSGLRIMTPVYDHKGVVERLVTNGHAHAYVLLFLLFVAVSLVATTIRRRRDVGFPDRWLDGFTTCLKEVISVAKSGELPTREPNWLRNLLVSAWMIFGMALLAYITSTVSSAMTMASLRQRGEIHELGDLPGHTVAVLSGSGAETHLPRLGIRVVPYGSRDDDAAAVRAREADAFVADTAVLEYWAAEHPEARVHVTGRPFRPYKFAFATSRDRPPSPTGCPLPLSNWPRPGRSNNSAPVISAKAPARTPTVAPATTSAASSPFRPCSICRPAARWNDTKCERTV